MNLFWLDEDPVLCAQFHCDQHVNKLIVECAQVLCDASHAFGLGAPYKPGQIHHPISRWTRASLSNYLKACDYGLHLSHEALRRRIASGKSPRMHKSAAIVAWCFANPPPLPDIGPTLVYQAFGKYSHLRNPLDHVSAYRDYYRTAKRKFATWRYTPKPYWW